MTDLHHQIDAVSKLDRITCELREEHEHERNRRLDMVDVVNLLLSER